MASTSLTKTFDFEASVLSFSPATIVDAAQTVMENLVPLVGTGSLLHEDVTDALKLILHRFVKALNTLSMATGHMDYGLKTVSEMLGYGDNMGPSDIEDRLQKIAGSFLCGGSNALEAQRMCTALGEDVEKKIQLLEDSYGTDSFIQVSTKGGTERLAIQNLGATINKHMGQLTRSCTHMLTLIQASNRLLRAYLDDKQSSLKEPPTKALVWSRNLIAWRGMVNSFHSLNTGLLSAMRLYPSWFVCTNVADQYEFLKLDQETRNNDVVQPQPKIKVPENTNPEFRPSQPLGWTPRRIMNSEELAASLESLERTSSGTVSIKLHLTAYHSNPRFNRLKKIHIICQVPKGDGPSPIRFINIKPTSLKDIKADTAFVPKGCRPVIDVDGTTESTAKWTFSRPIYRWNAASVIPSQLTISLDVVHESRVRIEFYAVVRYYRAFMLPLFTSENVVLSKPIVLVADNTFLDAVSP